MVDTFTDVTTFDVHLCPTCGVQYAAPIEFFRRKDRESQGWYCVNGHSLKYTKSALQKAKEQLARVERDRAWYETREREATAARLRAERSNAALRGHLTRIRTRIAAGVCPVPGCRRSGFAQVMRHLASKHPDWLAEHVHELDANA